jgi:hypothetical protein
MIARAFELEDAINFYAVSKRIDLNITSWVRFKVIHELIKGNLSLSEEI